MIVSPIEQLLTRLGVEWRKGYMLCPQPQVRTEEAYSQSAAQTVDRAVMADPIWLCAG